LVDVCGFEVQLDGLAVQRGRFLGRSMEGEPVGFGVEHYGILILFGDWAD